MFCGHTRPMTKEDVIPIWVGRVLKEIFPDVGRWAVVDRVSNLDGQVPLRARRSGGPTIYKLKAVCKECNGGWMRGIENAVIPLLTPLIRGVDDSSTFSANEAQAIATWMTLKVLCFDRLAPSVFGRDECQDFYYDRLPPPMFQLWMAKSEQISFTGEFHPLAVWNIGWYGTTSSPTSPHDRSWARRLTLLINELVLQAVMVRKDRASEVALIDRPDEYLLPQIWPWRGPIDWPPPVLLTHSSVASLGAGRPSNGIWKRKGPEPPPLRNHKPRPYR